MTEIILLGTFHYSGREDIFTESMQREIDSFTDMLTSLQPTKIALELPRRYQNDLDSFYNLFQPFHLVQKPSLGTYQAYNQNIDYASDNERNQIGFRLARKLNHSKIYAVDEDIELSDQLFNLIAPHISLNNYLNQMNAISKSASNLVELYRVLNSEEYIDYDNSIYVAMNKVNLGNYEGCQLLLQWYERNLKIFSNLQNICQEGDRILVLIGSSHLKILRDLVSSDPSLELVNWK